MASATAPKQLVEVGQVFSKLTVLRRAANCPANLIKRWHVRCTCGQEKVVLQRSLISGKTGSCAGIGCKLDRRSKDTMMVTAHGKTQPLRAWASEVGISPQTLKLRWGRGKRGEALLVPVRKYPAVIKPRGPNKKIATLPTEEVFYDGL